MRRWRGGGRGGACCDTDRPNPEPCQGRILRREAAKLADETSTRLYATRRLPHADRLKCQHRLRAQEQRPRCTPLKFSYSLFSSPVRPNFVVGFRMVHPRHLHAHPSLAVSVGWSVGYMYFTPSCLRRGGGGEAYI